ncbi:glycosyltransferase family 2 protein [Cobetia sp. L2A1]|uniref:glycosyltransferase family 2 protein n=1 Tax=Cobetia sp. L2A1 TaxID=2686360 RepID=UPI00131CDB21|nr:glycosyltransferase family 2 protein [Cobetia sp. L2A1]
MALVTEHTPYFSIVTPNYNSGNSLAACIASLESNTASYEHIIVDDGSSDEAFALAEKRVAEGKGQQLVLKRNPRNVGPGRTRNHALRLVTGRYVVFCDADDHLAPGALDRLKAEIESFRSPDVIVFRYCLHNQKGKVASLALCETPRECQPGEAFADFMHDRIVSAPWGRAIRAELACALEFIDLPVEEDGIYNLELFGCAERILYIPDILYHFDKRQTGTLTRKPFNNSEFGKFHSSWTSFDHLYRTHFATQHGEQLLEMRALRFICINSIMRQAINKAQDDHHIRKAILKQIRQSSFASLRRLSFKEKVLLASYVISPFIARQLIRKSQYA